MHFGPSHLVPWQIPGHFKSGRVAVRLSEAGPRLRLLLIKARPGAVGGQQLGPTVGTKVVLKKSV